MTDPFTFNPLHIRCDEVEYTVDFGSQGLSGGGGSNISLIEIWYYPLPTGERLEASSGFAWVCDGGFNTAPKTAYKPSFLTDDRLVSLQNQHADWLAGLSAHEKLAIAAAQRESGA